jgi:hypothetical protein
MTREEAKSCIGTIEMLQRLAYNIHGVMDVIDADNCKKIIKALEQEPCEDAVSRQQAIEFVNEVIGGKNELADAIRDGVEAVLSALPSVTPQEPRWISVKEKLPEERLGVLVWCPSRKNIYCACYENKQWWIVGSCWDRVTSEIVAWMPLPKPYGVESEE